LLHDGLHDLRTTVRKLGCNLLDVMFVLVHTLKFHCAVVRSVNERASRINVARYEHLLEINRFHSKRLTILVVLLNLSDHFVLVDFFIA
jgi:hypothetical protein